MFDTLPDQDRQHRLAVLERADASGQGRDRSGRALSCQLAAVAERWYELGEREKAKTLMTDAVRLAKTLRR